MLEPFVSLEVDGIDAGFEGLLCDPGHMERVCNYMESKNLMHHLKENPCTSDSVGILKNIWVEEEERGSGVGTFLLDEFIDLAIEREMDVLYLIADTLESNDFDLVSWYEKKGFERLTEGECPLMRLCLNGES